MNKSPFRWWKLIAVWLTFLLLHFSYETFPNTLFKIIGEEGETTFFHMKMLFFAYVFISIIEYFVHRKEIASTESFVYTRILLAVAYPWMTITIWFTMQALGFPFEESVFEIVYANITTLLGIYLALRLEEALLPVTYRGATKWMLILLLATALLSYIAFSFNTPTEFFITPAY